MKKGGKVGSEVVYEVIFNTFAMRKNVPFISFCRIKIDVNKLGS